VWGSAAVGRRNGFSMNDRGALHATAVLETSDYPADAIVKYAEAREID
jgi:hypothetical protein